MEEKVFDDKLYPVQNDPSVPRDWDDPDWEKYDKVHGWRNYVPAYVQELWPTFNRRQQQLLAKAFQEMADQEDWD